MKIRSLYLSKLGSYCLIFILLLLIHLCDAQIYITFKDYLTSLDDKDATLLTSKDFENALLLNNEIVRSSPKRRLLTHQKYYRGDIRGKAAWKTKLTKTGVRRNGVTNVVKKWANGRIPYVLSTQYNERERAVLARAFQEYHTKTCIRFVPKTAFDNDYLYIGKIDGCFSDVGRAGGRQELSLDDGCLQYDTAIHELMHSVGFYHEHERWDRDTFITILWHNIDKEAYDQFGRVDLSESSYYGQPYDYHSIMHYDSMAFSKNGFETMIAKQPGMTSIIGSAIDFSNVDLTKIRKMYQCAGYGTNQPTFNSWNLPTTPAPFVPLTSVAPVFQSFNHDVPEICADKTTLCWRWLDRCHSFFFEKIMREFCPLSCGFCTPQSMQTQTVLQPRIPPPPQAPLFPRLPAPTLFGTNSINNLENNIARGPPIALQSQFPLTMPDTPFYQQFGRK
uniref:Metalloendopeptidase n=1 Tax=Acrobeloides nanus TaxID=290746 RepID=A0A914CA48_9BILA